MPIEIRSATDSDVRQFAQWRYEPPYGAYDIAMEPQAAIDYFLQDDIRCHALIEKADLVGFCTFGQDAQVPGGDYEDDVLDIGLGMRPDHTNSGRGREYVEAVVDYALEWLGTDGLRVTIAEGNRRAIKVWAAAGFLESSRFETEREVLNSQDWVILRREAI